MCDIEIVEEIVSVRRTIRMRKKIVGQPMELCLCSRCASQFYNSPDHYIKRADQFQIEKDLCTFCNHRNGYDFLVFDLVEDPSGFNGGI